MAYLAILSGLPQRVLELPDGQLTLGRAPEATFQLNHPRISRTHCQLQGEGENWLVEDLGGALGTQVNGKTITAPTPLKSGDRLVLGPISLEFGLGIAPNLTPATQSDQPGEVLYQNRSTRRIPLHGELVFGRENADVLLPNAAVSRRHAQIRPHPNGGFAVVDLNSSAGSFVNGHRFDEHALTIGDRLQIGPFCFQFDGQALQRIAQAEGGSLRAEALLSQFGTLKILDRVSLSIPASRFVGILGPSGAGKSSLLHALAGLQRPHGGRVWCDGRDVYADPPSFGFVPQEDIVHPELTVIQALRFSARLRLPKNTPKLELHKLLLQTMGQLGLRARADVSISRLSGGQRKRVSVGVELLGKPAVLFLDEPTSGLDPATEFQLMELLRDLADTGCTIICTTHVLENAFLMDQLAILVGGCLAFSGSLNEAREYFAVSKLNALYDKLLDRPAKDWQQQFEAQAPPPEAPPSSPAPETSSKSKPFALPILLHRQWTIMVSDWRNSVLFLGQPLIIAALVSWVTDERALVMFFAYLATLWFGCSNAAQEIVKELAIYRRERLIGVGAHSYLISKFLFLTTATLIQSLLLYGALLWGEGGRDGAVYWQLAALTGTSLAAVGIGLTVSSFSRTVVQAVMLVPLIIIPQIVFSGYTVPASDMTRPVRALSQWMPSFAAQTLFDTSFLWKKPLSGQTISDHAQSYRNLDPDRELTSRDLYSKAQPAQRSILVHGLWAIGTYLASFLALRKRER